MWPKHVALLIASFHTLLHSSIGWPIDWLCLIDRLMPWYLYAICFYINLWSNTFECFKVPPSHFVLCSIGFAAISILDFCLCMSWNVCMAVIVVWLVNGFVQSLIKSAFRHTNTHTHTSSTSNEIPQVPLISLHRMVLIQCLCAVHCSKFGYIIIGSTIIATTPATSK